jgi:hypothetical protein
VGSDTGDGDVTASAEEVGTAKEEVGTVEEDAGTDGEEVSGVVEFPHPMTTSARTSNTAIVANKFLNDNLLVIKTDGFLWQFTVQQSLISVEHDQLCY